MSASFDTDLTSEAVQTLKFLAVDAVEKARSQSMIRGVVVFG